VAARAFRDLPVFPRSAASIARDQRVFAWGGTGTPFTGKFRP
jgi:hypothetical protein